MVININVTTHDFLYSRRDVFIDRFFVDFNLDRIVFSLFSAIKSFEVELNRGH